jgi:peptidoglycan/LPS O-acetylase OafA/YrhL
VLPSPGEEPFPVKGSVKPTSDSSTLYAFDFVRANAILFVLIGHWLALQYRYELWGHPVTIHPVGMGLFFFISGYLIFRTLSVSPRISLFFFRRLLRISPSVIVISVALTVAAAWSAYRSGAPLPDTYSLSKLAQSITFTGDLFGNLNIYCIDFWSLHTETRFYILIGLCYFFFRSRSALGLAGAILALYVAGVLALHRVDAGHSFGGIAHNFFCIGYILFGVWYYLYDEKKISLPAMIAMSALTWLTMKCYGLFLLHRSLVLELWDNHFIGVVLAIVLVRMNRILRPNAFFTFVAAISYPLYLLHHVALLRYGTLGIPVACGVATVVHYAVERPCIRFSKRFGKRFSRERNAAAT